MERSLYKGILEAPPRLELKAVTHRCSTQSEGSQLLGDPTHPRAQLGTTGHLRTRITVARHWVRGCLPVLWSDCPVGCPPFQIHRVAESFQKTNQAVFCLFDNS